MPHGSHVVATRMLDVVTMLKPRRVLDIGAGFGKWGLLVREALDFMAGRLTKDAWTTTIDGIDVFPYESPLHAWVYDSFRVVDAREIASELAGYDVVVLADVIEHLSKSDGTALVEALLAGNTNLLVTTPLHFFEQESEDNPHEQHVSHWTLADFARWTCDYDVLGGSVIVVVLAGNGARYPTAAHRRASLVAYRLPGMAARGLAPQVIKRMVLAVFDMKTLGR